VTRSFMRADSIFLPVSKLFIAGSKLVFNAGRSYIPDTPLFVTSIPLFGGRILALRPIFKL
jgi:hypothetical protein